MPTLRQGSKRQTIKRHIVNWIAEQELSPGDQILSQNRLASLFQTTPVTVHKALTELASEGILYRQQGSGTYVGPKPVATGSICLVLPDEHLDQAEYNPIYWPYVQTLMRAFMEGAGSSWTFTTRAFGENPSFARLVGELTRYDLLFFHYAQRPIGLMEALIETQKVPVVAFGRPQPELDCLTVDHDKPAGIAMAVDYLFKLGYRRIGLVRSRQWWGNLAQSGYESAMEAAGLPFDHRLVIQADETQASGFAATGELVKRNLRLDAVLNDADSRALGVIERLEEEGMSIPRDIGVMSYDGVDLYAEHTPYLTTVKIPYRQMIQAVIDEYERAPRQPFARRHMDFLGTLLPGRTCRQQAVVSQPSA